MVFACNIGILFAFILGNFFSYITSPIVLMGIPVLFLMGILFFPETPQFLIKCGKEEVGI